MVLRLSNALEMPKSAANQALGAAGFAPAYPRLDLVGPDLAPVRRAIEIMLTNHEPLPAIAIDRGWNILNANAGAGRLFAAVGAIGAVSNMIELLIALGPSDVIANWEETAALALLRLHAEIAHLGADDELQRLAARLAAHPRLAAAGPIDTDQAVIPTTFNLGGERLSVFSTIAQFGSVQDVFASEIRVELMFPADDAARRFFQLRAG